jgi:hypothetical protein
VPISAVWKSQSQSHGEFQVGMSRNGSDIGSEGIFWVWVGENVGTIQILIHYCCLWLIHTQHSSPYSSPRLLQCATYQEFFGQTLDFIAPECQVHCRITAIISFLIILQHQFLQGFAQFVRFMRKGTGGIAVLWAYCSSQFFNWLFN